eukprot:TRINITY_DN4392_c0_g1_i10.p1 TRINITY_DN4392_c0_g1~~TRINITY_DN4392_c0_g1_i10.p1  ORF type:complete len:238 (+),score=-15.05 TRINITY_DN4392_c0_g1_i10:967-1680(+)
MHMIIQQFMMQPLKYVRNNLDKVFVTTLTASYVRLRNFLIVFHKVCVGTYFTQRIGIKIVLTTKKAYLLGGLKHSQLQVSQSISQTDQIYQQSENFYQLHQTQIKSVEQFNYIFAMNDTDTDSGIDNNTSNTDLSLFSIKYLHIPPLIFIKVGQKKTLMHFLLRFEIITQMTIRCNSKQRVVLYKNNTSTQPQQCYQRQIYRYVIVYDAGHRVPPMRFKKIPCMINAICMYNAQYIY